MSVGAKRARMVAAIAVGIGLATAGIAHAAPGDVVLTGATREGATVKLTVATAGNATKFKVGKTKVECNQGGTLSNKSGTYTGLDRSDPGSFSDRRKSSSDAGGYHFQTKSNLKGAINADNATWSGTMKLSTKVFQDGDQIDTCQLTTAWDAS